MRGEAVERNQVVIFITHGQRPRLAHGLLDHGHADCATKVIFDINLGGFAPIALRAQIFPTPM